MRIAILTTSNQWFVEYAKKLNNILTNSDLYHSHEEIYKTYEILFILSYHKIIEDKHLNKNKHNIVIHASSLPQGKGWAPLFWQILEGKNNITFSMFEASSGIDDGHIYMKSTLKLTGNELNQKLREKQANFIMQMCLEFINKYDIYRIPKKQNGEESFYPKRTKKDSELDIGKTLDEQFNLLRIVDNENYPAFFYKNNIKYILKIQEVNDENR